MHRLLLTATGSQLTGLSTDDLLWRPHGEPSSVETTLGPRLEDIGDVPPLYIDFVRLAATVFFVDRTVLRPRMLRRRLDIEVAVHDPTAWEPHSARLGAVLGLLSGDEWTVSFRRRREPRQGPVKELTAADVSLLFSGGADSMCGALLARDEGLAPLLVSHFDWRNIGGQQNSGTRTPSNSTSEHARRTSDGGSPGARLRSDRARRSPTRLPGEPARCCSWPSVQRSARQPEPTCGSQRTGSRRSIHRCRRSRSARCQHAPHTHPSSPACGRRSQDVGLNFPVVNRFADKTKGQVFIEATQSLDKTTASAVLSATHSCGKPQRLRGYAPDAQCGVCLGCLVRRGAFIAAGISDQTPYLELALTGPRRAHWLSDERLSAYRALQERLAAGFDDDDVLGLGLPDDADLDAALRLIKDGLHELSAVQVS